MAQALTPLDWALRYARLGFPVLPTRPNAKLPWTERGVHSASVRDDEVISLFADKPGAGVAIAMGAPAGAGRIVIAIDIDVKNDGPREWARLIAGRILPSTLMARSGSGGTHMLFLVPNTFKAPFKLRPGVEVIGVGRYILVEPSCNESGGSYHWECRLEQPIADAPAWLLEEIAKAATTTLSLEGDGSLPKVIEGGRHNFLVSMRGKLARMRLSPAIQFTTLLALNHECCVPPVDEREVHTIAFSSDTTSKEPLEDFNAGPKSPTTIADVIERWRNEGPLVHEACGLATLDEATGGGLVYGSRVYLNGAPDAGKTALLIQWADELASKGVFVGIHAVDEEDGDVVTRLAQRAGFLRSECETRSELGSMAARLPSNIVFYDSSWTLEAATDDLAARGQGRRLAYFADSIQTITCAKTLAATKEPSSREVITSNVWALRAAASKHKLLAVATSEMNRAAFRNVDSAEQTNDMASGSGSSAIEYSARVLLALRSIKDSPDKIHLRVVKNKLGRSSFDIYLSINRACQRLSESTAPDASDTSKLSAKVEREAQSVLRVIISNPGIGGRVLRSKSGMGRDTLQRALDVLEGKTLIENREEHKGKLVIPHYYAIPRSVAGDER